MPEISCHIWQVCHDLDRRWEIIFELRDNISNSSPIMFLFSLCLIHIHSHTCKWNDTEDSVGMHGPGLTQQDAKIRATVGHFLSKNLSHALIMNHSIRRRFDYLHELSQP